MIFEIHHNRTWADGIKVIDLYIDDPSAGHPNEPHFTLSIYRATSHYILNWTPPPNIMSQHLTTSCEPGRSKVYGINSYMPTQKAFPIPTQPRPLNA